MGDSILAAATMNPMFRNAAVDAMFQSANADDPETIKRNANVYASNQNVLTGVTEKELSGMKYWANIIKYAMLIVSTLMIATSYLNIGTSTANISTSFLALYVFFFSTIICCYEVAFKMISTYIVQNFGFMYNPWGRFIFLILVAIMLFQLSVMGKVVFALLLVVMLLQIYVDFKYRQFEKFIRLTHLHIKIQTDTGVPV
jgi:hypothetical protein